MMMQMMQMMVQMQQNSGSAQGSQSNNTTGIQLINQPIDTSVPTPNFRTLDVHNSVDIPSTNPYKKARNEGLMDINEGDGMMIKVSAGPTFGADIIADGSDSGVSIHPKKKKKKKAKVLQSVDITAMMQDHTMDLLQNRIVEAKKEEEDDQPFTLVGVSKPVPVTPAAPIEEEIALPMISPFGGKKKKAKKRKKLPNFDELDLEAFNID